MTLLRNYGVSLPNWMQKLHEMVCATVHIQRFQNACNVQYRLHVGKARYVWKAQCSQVPGLQIGVIFGPVTHIHGR